jgi:hypothetical protein
VSIPDAEITVIKVDGGHDVQAVNHTTNTVGTLYPAERVDFILGWREAAREKDSQLIISLDHEWELLPVLQFGWCIC